VPRLPFEGAPRRGGDCGTWRPRTWAQEALSDAAASGDVPRLRDLLASGAKCDAPDRAGFTALHRTCIGGSPDSAAFLLAAGASANATDVFGDAPLHYACFAGSPDLVRTLLNGGADVALLAHDGRSPLSIAVAEGHTAIVDMLLKAAHGDGGTDAASGTVMAAAAAAAAGGGVDTSSSSSGGGVATPPLLNAALTTAVLCDCAFTGDVRTVYRCLVSGVDVNGCDPDGITPLHRACAGGHTLIVELLVDHSADVNARDPVSAAGGSLTPRVCAGRCARVSASSLPSSPCVGFRVAERVHADALRCVDRPQRRGARAAGVGRGPHPEEPRGRDGAGRGSRGGGVGGGAAAVAGVRGHRRPGLELGCGAGGGAAGETHGWLGAVAVAVQARHAEPAVPLPAAVERHGDPDRVVGDACAAGSGLRGCVGGQGADSTVHAAPCGGAHRASGCEGGVGGR